MFARLYRLILLLFLVSLLASLHCYYVTDASLFFQELAPSPDSLSLKQKMAEPNLKARKRSDYIYFLVYRTRWSVSLSLKSVVRHKLFLQSRSDNDQYSHINNSIYYHLFDSIVNTYLIEECGLDPKSSPLIGLVVSSYCQVCMGHLKSVP